MNIRPAETRDRAEWLRLRSALWPSPRADHTAEIDSFLAALPEGRPPLAAVLVCEDSGGRLTGFLELSVRDYAEGCAGPAPYVEGWYVDREARRRGVGHGLLRAAERWAREHGYSELASDTELDNLISYEAHLAFGFEEVERAIHFRKPV